MSANASQIQEISEGYAVEKKLINRLLHACVREQLLPYVLKDNSLFVTLEKSKKTLLATRVERFKLGKLKISGEVFTISDQNCVRINETAYLLDLIHDELKDEIDAEQWKKFVAEILNCGMNEKLVHQFMQQFNNKLANDMLASGHENFLEYIQANYTAAERLMFFEAWASRGHPYHPCHKTKLGFSNSAYLKYSPEFDQNIQLPVVAIEKSIIQVAAEQSSFDYNLWFSQTFPEAWHAWCEKLKGEGLSDTNYSPLFVHPWQLDNVLNKLFHNIIANKQLIPFHDVCITTKASLSFRTLMVKDNSTKPHIKLPVAVYSTSAMRTVSHISVHNGPQLGKVLKQILQKETMTGTYLKFAYESCGLHIQHENPEIAKNLSVIYRENPAIHVNEKQIPIVVAALFEVSPVSKLPLFIEIMQAAKGKSLAGAIEFFDRYCRVVMMAYLDLFLIYGIALEGHQQNTISVFENNDIAFLIARDLGGLRVHLPTLLTHDQEFIPHPQSSTVTNDREDVTNMFLHTVIQYHLGEIILLMAQHYQTSESVFWKVVKDNIEKRFHELKDCVDPTRWEQEHKAILFDDWQIKGLMRMRLKNLAYSFIYVYFKNPLRDA